MAFATQITITTGSKVSANFQSQEVNIGVTYQLERGDEDLLAVADAKAAEVESVHRHVWYQLQAERDRHRQSKSKRNGYHSNGQSNGRPSVNGAGGKAGGYFPDSNGDSTVFSPQTSEVNAQVASDGIAGHSSCDDLQACEEANGGEENSSQSSNDEMTSAQSHAVASLTNSLAMTVDELEAVVRMICGKGPDEVMTKSEASKVITDLQHKQRLSRQRTGGQAQ